MTITRLIIAALAGLIAFSAQALQAGAAKAEITPEHGTPLDGHAYRMGRGAVETHDPLWTRALYLEEGDVRVYLVTVDLYRVTPALRSRVLELAPSENSPAEIILVATHTHSGAGGMAKPVLDRWVAGRYMPELVDQMAKTIVQTMKKAFDNRRRGAIGFGTAQHRVLSEHASVEDGPIDTQIGVIRVDDFDGFPIAIVANFAARPATVGRDFAYAFSADFPGYYYQELEELTSPGSVGIFLNGGAANQVCGNPENMEGWQHTESIGRLLAIRAKEVANRIQCGEAVLRFNAVEASLPPTLSGERLAGKTVLQTLEINNLLMTFLPGAPSVETALELRTQAIDHGYDVQFTVGLANDYQGAFVTDEGFRRGVPEAERHLHGPRFDDWLAAQMAGLASKMEHPSDPAAQPSATVADENGFRHVIIGGSPYSMGFQRGAAFRQSIQDIYTNQVVVRVESGELVPEDGWWSWAPSFWDFKPAALPRLAASVRPLLAPLSDAVLDEVRGMADAAGMPFDALWLVQCGPYSLREKHISRLYEPLCTTFAALGDRAGADRLLVGRNFDWDGPGKPVVIETHPDSGHAYVQVGFEWNVGVFTGMNDAGIVAAVESAPFQGQPAFEVPPIETVLRDLLTQAGNLERAQALISGVEGLRGYHVLLASADEETGVVAELGETVTFRKPAEGLLLTMEPERDGISDDIEQRYGRLHQLLADERILSVDEIQEILADRESGTPEKARILNRSTRHCVIFDPSERTVHVAIPEKDGTMRSYTEIRLTEDPA